MGNAIASAAVPDDCYRQQEDGVYCPVVPVTHRDDEYQETGFDVLLEMQERHFWYRGRHRFLLSALRRELRRRKSEKAPPMNAIDLGGGCGGWIRYLQRHCPGCFAELALGDSSRKALQMAQPVIGTQTSRYQIDLQQLGWDERWDVAFLLDVLEHIPEDAAALREIRAALRPGGLLFVTTPALKFFWSYNDEIGGHQRRYSRQDFSRLARACGLELCYSRYFMFLLSPLYLLSRRNRPDLESMSPQEIAEHLQRAHRTPIAPVNAALSFAFALETPLGLTVPFPWGTSILAVFRRPRLPRVI